VVDGGSRCGEQVTIAVCRHRHFSHHGFLVYAFDDKNRSISRVIIESDLVVRCDLNENHHCEF
jgi:hypothetical protein